MARDPMIALLVITDGRREHLAETLASADAMLEGPISERWIYDDSGDPANHEWILSIAPDFELITHPAGRQGFGGAIRTAWSAIDSLSRASYIFHLEDDFTFNRPVPLDDMAWTLGGRRHLAQLALRRQPWNDAAGGIVEMHPDDYHEFHVQRGERDLAWLEHRRNFTTNPSLYRRRLTVDHPWPTGQHSEGRFGIDLLAEHPGYRFGYWGARDSGEWVTHNGAVRNGTGY
jgi:hypothetical protein